MSDLELRRAEARDRDRLVEGNVRMARETEDLALDPEVVARGVGRVLSGEVDGQFWVVVRDGVVVGQALVTREWSDWRDRHVWWLQSVYVWPEARSLGVYRRLHDHVRAEARRAGAGGLRLYVDATNTRAQAVYQRVGMTGGHYLVFEQMDLGGAAANDGP
jgi:GNAT superfamily N-acetyltransferase